MSSNIASSTRSRFFAVIVEADNSHLPQPLLNHFVNQTVVPNEASFVFGRVIAVRTLVEVSLLNSLTKSFPEMTIGQVTQEHVTAAEIAAAQRTSLAIGFVSFQSFQNGFVVTLVIAGTLVQELEHHLVVDAVMSNQKLQIFSFEAASRTSERSEVRQVGSETVQEVLVGGVTDKVS